MNLQIISLFFRLMVDIVSFDEFNFADAIVSECDLVNSVTLDDLGDLDSGLNGSWLDDQSESRSPTKLNLRRSSSIADSNDSFFEDLDLDPPSSPTCSVVTNDILPLSDLEEFDSLLKEVSEKVYPNSLIFENFEAVPDQPKAVPENANFSPIVPPSQNIILIRPKTGSRKNPIPKPPVVLIPKLYTLDECARKGIKVQLPKVKRKNLKRVKKSEIPVEKIPEANQVVAEKEIYQSLPNLIENDLDSVLKSRHDPFAKSTLDLKMRDLKMLLPSFQMGIGGIFSRFPCTECGKSHRNREELRFCLRTHRKLNSDKEIVKRRTCKTCKKIFSSPTALKTHELVHSGEKPFPCGFCFKKFREKSCLKKHVKRIHPESFEEFLKKK